MGEFQITVLYGFANAGAADGHAVENDAWDNVDFDAVRCAAFAQRIAVACVIVSKAEVFADAERLDGNLRREKVFVQKLHGGEGGQFFRERKLDERINALLADQFDVLLRRADRHRGGLRMEDQLGIGREEQRGRLRVKAFGEIRKFLENRLMAKMDAIMASEGGGGFADQGAPRP